MIGEQPILLSALADGSIDSFCIFDCFIALGLPDILKL